MSNKHTFIVLAYKESPFLEDCLQSLFAQSISSDIILATSTPNAFLQKIAKKYDLEIKINTGEKGLAPDWNFALKQSQTEYVTLAHQDDIYLPNYTKEMLKDLEKHPDFLLKFCDYQEIYHGLKETKLRTWTLNLLIKRLLIFFSFFCNSSISSSARKKRFLGLGSPIPCPSVLYHVTKLKNFTFSSKFRINADWIAWIDLANRQGEFLKSSKILMQHRIHAGSETTRGLQDHIRQDEDLICFKKLWPKPLVKFFYSLYSISYRTNS